MSFKVGDRVEYLEPETGDLLIGNIVGTPSNDFGEVDVAIRIDNNPGYGAIRIDEETFERAIDEGVAIINPTEESPAPIEAEDVEMPTPPIIGKQTESTKNEYTFPILVLGGAFLLLSSKKIK